MQCRVHVVQTEIFITMVFIHGYLYWHQQEVFEVRYSKVPKEPESNLKPTQQPEGGKELREVESTSTSKGSESENVSDSDSSSEKMVVQLASLEKRVGIYTNEWTLT